MKRDTPPSALLPPRTFFVLRSLGLAKLLLALLRVALLRALPCLVLLCLALPFSLYTAGCGLGSLQTARPTPPKTVDLSVGFGYVYNENIKARDGEHALGNFPLMLNSRWGLIERMDLGVRLFMLAGGAADVKVNLMPATHALAVSLAGGIGMCKDFFAPSGAWALNLPLSAHISYDLPFDITPYAAVGYSSFWIFNRDGGRDADDQYADREGYGDGLLTVNSGVKVNLSEMVSMFFEYNYLHPVVNDPGDFYTFVDNHVVLGGLALRISFGGPNRVTQPSPASGTPVPSTNEPAPPPPPPPPRI
jgi:hypothetical protein